MKKLLFFIIFCLFISPLFPQQVQYHRISISVSYGFLERLQQLGLDMHYHLDADEIIAEVSDDELKKLTDADIPYRVMISNISEFYKRRNLGKDPQKITNAFRNREDYAVPEHFSLGSMGGFCTWEEINMHLDTMHALFPDLISEKEALPTLSVEGRPIYWLRISDNPNQNEDEPEVFYNALIHAREPASAQQMLYFMYYLLENYDTDAEIQQLVDHTELYFVPCINPDGYVYNESEFPDGGGMWRKNRRTNYNNSMGVDPNRNFGFMWGYDDIGSSPAPNSSVYRGEAAFSEPEIQAVRDFTMNHDFKLVFNYHSFGNLLLFSWGYVSYFLPDDYAHLRDMAVLLTRKNDFSFGAAPKLLYLVNGGATDWFYGEQEQKPSVFSFTPEVGNDEFGFWPPMEEIIPQCQSCLEMNMVAAQMAGCYTEIMDADPVNITKTSGYISFELRRIGLTDMPFSATINPIGSYFDSIGAPITIENLPGNGFYRDSVFYRLKPGLVPGDQISYVISIENDAFATSDTITRIFGPSEIIFEDHFNDLANWDNDDWFIRDDDFFSPQYAVSNVDNNYYPNNSESHLLLNDIMLQNETDAVWVSYQAKWDLDGGRDYIKFVYSTDLGQTWLPLEGRYSSLIFDGSDLTPVYQGASDFWMNERILITGIKNIPLKFGFSFTSDNQYGRSGFYCDDFRIFTSDLQTIAQSIYVGDGWTGISSYLIPIDPDISAIFGDHISQVDFLTNDEQFYQPGNNNGTLTNWTTMDGLMVKASQPFQLTINGYPENCNTMNLNAGWNLISIISDQPVNVNELVTEPAGVVKSVKEACGIEIWWPQKNINGLSHLQPGKSYFIYMNQDAKLKIQ